MVKMSRYFVSTNWVQQKITARIDVPEHLDLRAYRGAGPQSDDKLMAQETEAAGGSAAAGSGGVGDTPAFQVCWLDWFDLFDCLSLFFLIFCLEL